MNSPLVKFTYFYFIGGVIALLLCGMFYDLPVAKFLTANWLAVGIALALIIYGIGRKSDNATAAFFYYLGIAWLIVLFIAGVILISNDGIGVRELNWLTDWF